MSTYVFEVAKLSVPPGSAEPRFLAVIRAFCDESHDGESKVYTIGGFLARDKDWASLSKQWRNRCLRDRVRTYHSADCEGAYRDFNHLSKQGIVELNTDLIDCILTTQIAGFATSILLEDYRKVASRDERAKRILGPSPYFMALQMFIVTLCSKMQEDLPDLQVPRIPFVFDQNEEFSGRAKQLYDEIKRRNPKAAQCMGTLTYADKERFVPLQVADKLAYEAMKHVLNMKFDPDRKERIALTRLKAKIRALNLLDERALDHIVSLQD